MKRCPECRRRYSDDSLRYCLEDGSVLVEGPPPAEDRATMILPASKDGDPTAVLEVDKASPSDSDTVRISKKKILAGVLGISLLALMAAAGYYWFGRQSILPVGTVAVFPFANETGHPELEYLSDGMTESLIASLSQLPNVRVKARSSVFRYKGRAVEPRSVGRELGVEAIVSGRLVQTGNAVTLYVELVDAATEDILWKQDYARPLTNVVQMQNELAKDVGMRLRAELSGSEEARLKRSQTTDPEAYNLYLLGRFHVNRLTDDGFNKAVQYFGEAAAKDPDFALAYAGLADAYNRLGAFNAAAPKDSFPRAKEAALKALELYPSLAAARAALATAKFYYDWDWPGAENEFKRALELDPDSADARQAYGFFLAAMGRFAEAEKEAVTARDLEPLSIERQIGVGDIYRLQRRTDDAMAAYEKALEMDPNSGLANWAMGLSLAGKLMYPEAIAAFQKSIPLSGDSPDESLELARAYALSGRKEEAVRIVNEIKASMSRRYVSPTIIGSVYADLGNKDQAFYWFERAIEERDFVLVALQVEPIVDRVRSDPRFATLIRRVGLPAVQLR